ncbi:MAG: PD40 domain-containing protein [Saprospiraceae bacterium]|nr:PD40 domain-containing protein [Saprospiraceae bacterium]
MKGSFIQLLFFCIIITVHSQNQSLSNALSSDYKIAYNVFIPDSTKDDWEIMCMTLDGSDKRNISQNPDVAWTYHSYGNKLFFISDRDSCYRCFYLYEMDAQGQQVRKISDLQLEDSWMSTRGNGEEIIVTGRIGKNIRHQLFIIHVPSGKFRQLTNDTTARYGDPCFSPDGNKIVFSLKKNKRDKSSHEELFLMNSDGSDVKQLTHYPQDNPSAKEYGYRAGAARWHPSENFISYVSKQNGRHSIFAITPDGSRKWKLIENEASEGWHDWSPDGQWLTYNGSDHAESQFHIYLMKWSSKETRQLTDNTYKSQLSPVFVKK